MNVNGPRGRWIVERTRVPGIIALPSGKMVLLNRKDCRSTSRLNSFRSEPELAADLLRLRAGQNNDHSEVPVFQCTIAANRGHSADDQFLSHSHSSRPPVLRFKAANGSISRLLSGQAAVNEVLEQISRDFRVIPGDSGLWTLNFFPVARAFRAL